MSSMDPLEAALARARSPSTFVESRPFTLSRERAIEKQRTASRPNMPIRRSAKFP